MILIIIGAVFGYISFIIQYDPLLKLICAVVSGSLIIIGIILSQRKQSICLTSSELKIVTTILNNQKEKSYLLNKIENLQYEENLKSNVYTSKGQVKVMGIDVTPESMKNHYYHKEIISFDYEGRSIEIGKWKKKFDGKILYNMIKQINN
ncbi:MAG TPA: hypothetical protein DDX57_13020 [Bacteroidales bacterium]|nr:hypothetical protein [Bacteroidales bacterium]